MIQLNDMDILNGIIDVVEDPSRKAVDAFVAKLKTAEDKGKAITYLIGCIHEAKGVDPPKTL